MSAPRLISLAALALLGACHKSEATGEALDAGADARARTAAKTLADLAAAEQAGGTALPPAPKPRPTEASPRPEAGPVDEGGNGT